MNITQSLFIQSLVMSFEPFQSLVMMWVSIRKDSFCCTSEVWQGCLIDCVVNEINFI